MKNWKYIEGAKTGNDTPLEYAHRKPKVINEDLKSYSEVLEKAKRELEKVKEKEKMADSIKSKEEWASARREIEDKIKYYQSRIGNDDKTGAEEFFKQLSDDVKEREKKDDKEIKLVGNETYQHKLYPDKYVIIEGNNYKIVTDGKVEKSGVLTDAVLYGINQTYKKVGNFKTGKSASDDKFAYVMREFDEGKLKTPDGKVVTDPAQAKAIAYRESKKTENGLARARNAIKKS